ncbi:MAG: tetratricopeptide repeat protein [Candidatus Bruticola sp.]
MSKAMRLADQAFNAVRVTPPCPEENINKALSLLDEALKEAHSCRDYIQIGLAYLEAGNSSEASQTFEKASKADPGNPSVPLFSALACIDADEFDKAQAFLNKLQELCPANQAAPTAQALLYLRQGNLEAALKIIFPPKGRFDLSVSPSVLTRLAVSVEEYILPRELPEIADDWETPFTCDVRRNSQPDTNQSMEDNQAEALQATEASDKESTSEELPADKPAEKHRSRFKSFLASTIPNEASSLASKGSQRLQKCWNLKPEKRLAELQLAKQELQEAYEKNPHIIQLAYDLGEACLGCLEFSHTAGNRISHEEVENLRQANTYFQHALQENKENAYTLHYLARVALLLREYRQAKEAWTLALKFFEKLPEAHYGLAQAYVMGKDFLRARQHMTLSLMSDMELLRERFQDLQQFFEKS